MSPLELEITTTAASVWRVGFEPDPWEWTPWQFATDGGKFDGRWDDSRGEFRTLYTAESLLGCFLELLAHFRPHVTLQAELDEIVDDDGTIGNYREATPGAVGYRWLDGRISGSATQAGEYCFITHSRTVAALAQRFPFHEHGIGVDEVDTALLKDARDRDLTRAIARWLYDLPGRGRRDLVDGVEFRSRHGDEIRVWAIFERSDDAPHSARLSAFGDPQRVTDETPELLEAFTRFGLHWHDEN